MSRLPICTLTGVGEKTDCGLIDGDAVGPPLC